MEDLFLIEVDKKITKYQLPTSVDKEVATYPSAYFAANNSKPKIKVYTITLEQESDARQRMAAELEKKALDIKFVSAYMWAYMGKISGELQEKWSSHGQTIGEDGKTITPRDLLEPQTEVYMIGNVSDTKKTEEEGWGFFWTLVAAFRLINIGLGRTQETYYNNIATRLDNHFTQSPWNAKPVKQIARMNIRLGDRLEYTALIGALDMFFNKFPTHDMSGSRVGTITSRNKGAAALSSLAYMKDITKMTYGKLFTYLPYPELLPEIKRLGKPEEQQAPHSYTHYIKVMGICKLSPYSSGANPLTYTLFHIIGSCLGIERSYNAANISANGRQALLMLGITASKFLTGSDTFTPIAGESEADAKLQAGAGAVVRRKEEGPTMQELEIQSGGKLDPDEVPVAEHGDGRDVLNALRLMTDIPLPWRRTLHSKLSQARVREGSVGDMLKKAIATE